MSMIIAGGGMAGATLALAVSSLSEGKLPVTLIESTVPGSLAHPGFDSRAIAIAAGTAQQLQRIGVWQSLAKHATPITDIHVSDRGHVGQVDIRHQDYQLPALGYVVELHQAGICLFELLKKAPGITLKCPRQLKTFQRTQEQVTVTLDDGEQIEAQMLVIANGTRSPLALEAGFNWQQQDYEQVAVIANVTTQKPHQGRAFERFTSQGPVALLPMSDNRLSLVWCHKKEKQQDVMQWDDPKFIDELQRAFGWRLGRFIDVGRRASYPLALQKAQRLVHHRVALVGNVAQTLHPIAGQGFNLGLRDVMSLAETVSQAYQQQQDIGSYGVLAQYQQRRENDRELTIRITDSLVRLFSNDNLPLVVARNLGLVAMNRLPIFKDLLAERTLGRVNR